MTAMPLKQPSRAPVSDSSYRTNPVTPPPPVRATGTARVAERRAASRARSACTRLGRVRRPADSRFVLSRRGKISPCRDWDRGLSLVSLTFSTGSSRELPRRVWSRRTMRCPNINYRGGESCHRRGDASIGRARRPMPTLLSAAGAETSRDRPQHAGDPPDRCGRPVVGAGQDPCRCLVILERLTDR